MILINYINHVKVRLESKHLLSETCLQHYRVLHFLRDFKPSKSFKTTARVVGSKAKLFSSKFKFL